MSRITIVNPRGAVNQRTSSFAPRPGRLEGIRLGLLNNAKPNSEHLLGMIYDQIRDRWGCEDAVTITKPIASGPCPPEQLDLLHECDAVLVGVGD